MKLRFFVIFLFGVSLHAAPMSRVIAIAGPSSIVVDAGGVRSTVQLAGIEIVDARAAAAFLSWSLQSSWVFIENGHVYRSPDGALVNAELVRKGFARYTDSSAPPHSTAAVYLGELDLGKRAAPRAPQPRARVVRRSTVRPPARPPRRAAAPNR